MNTYITAQLIGFTGYLILTGAPTFKDRKHIIKADILACLVLSVQWLILGQHSLLVLNMLNIVISLCALEISRSAYLKKMILLFYPIGGLILLGVSSGSMIDNFCLLGFFGLVASKTSEDIVTFRSFATLTCIAFVISGTLALSIPAVIFNAVRLLVHVHAISGILRLQEKRIPLAIEKSLSQKRKLAKSCIHDQRPAFLTQ